MQTIEDQTRFDFQAKITYATRRDHDDRYYDDDGAGGK